MQHKRKIKKYDGSLKELAEDIGNLHYDSLRELMEAISDKLEQDSKKDNAAGKKKLSQELLLASIEMNGVAEHIGKAWNISKPYMVDNPYVKIIEAQQKFNFGLFKAGMDFLNLNKKIK